MNRCINYFIPCPFALVVNPELPCFGTQEQCDIWVARIKRERPDWWEEGEAERRERFSPIQFIPNPYSGEGH